MNQTRLWVLLLVAVAFLGGLSSGLLIAERSAQKQRAQGEFGDFERAFVERFSLDLERQRLLAGLLDHYNLDRQRIKDHYATLNNQEMEPELRRVGLEYRSYLRDRLLPKSQRPEFDRLMASYVENL